MNWTYNKLLSYHINNTFLVLKGTNVVIISHK